MSVRVRVTFYASCEYSKLCRGTEERTELIGNYKEIG